MSAITAECCPPSERNDVRDGVEYAANGQNAATIVGEDYGSVVPSTSLALSRESVRAEAVTAMRNRSFGHSAN